MRIIHFADLHIGVENYGRPTEKGWSSRMEDFLIAFDALVDYALAEGADAVIFAGDAYKAREPSQTHQREFARRIRRLSQAGIPSFLLVGNHDLPNAEGRAHALEIYRTLDVPCVAVGDNAWFLQEGARPYVLETRAGPLQVAFLPWPQVSRFVASNPELDGMSIDQLHQAIEQKLTEHVQAQAEALDPDTPAILAAHVSINDFLVRENPGSEQWMTVGTAPTLLKSALPDGVFDYIALGHHHNNMDLQKQTPTWYSGSMQAVDFGEEGQAKGFMVLDIDPKKPAGSRVGGSGIPRLQAVPSRRFATVTVRPKADDPTPEVCEAIEKAAVADAIVRVEVMLGKPRGAKGDDGDPQLAAVQEGKLRIPEVRRLLDPAHFVAGIRTVKPRDARAILPAGVTTEGLGPLDTLDLYFKARQLDEKKRTQLRAAAEDIMRSAP
ncbi:MAG TPA: exonuclease SbcCD subunit D [Tepidiformaceae bacterium]|nr:exonuclease SbcCD subunit D [Tepidiformaceae bacterium]